MHIHPALHRLLLGSRFPEEYLCVAEDGYQDSLEFKLHSRMGEIDVTTRHLLLGYSPVLLGIDPGCFGSQNVPPDVTILVNTGSGKRLAHLELKLQEPASPLCLYEVTESGHRFLPLVQQLMQRLLDRRKRNQSGNVPLNRIQYDAVRIAYALPRRISLVSLGGNSGYNLFPTDLHGRCGTVYVDSLRREGLAAAQVQEAGRIVLSHVEPSAYRMAYRLGRNHMQPLCAKENFPFSTALSQHFHLPLAPDTVGYDELELDGHVDAGIHRIFFFRIVHTENVHSPTLAHVHSTPAAWRDRMGEKISYLLRTGETPVKSGS